MAKVRVFKLAKELSVPSALILELLDRMGQEVKSDLSTLDSAVADKVRARVTKAMDTERVRLETEAQQHPAEVETESPQIEPVDEPQPAEAEAAAADTESQETPAADATPVADVADIANDAVTPDAPQTVELPESEPTTPVDPAPTEAEPLAAASAVAETPAAPAAPTASGVRMAPAPPPAAPASTARAHGPSPIAPPPGGRKPRVFPARRIPAPGMLQRTKPGAPKPPAGASRTVPSAGRPLPPTPGRHTPGPHGRGAPPPKKRRRKKSPAEKQAAAIPARPKAELPPVPEKIQLSEGVTVKELAEKLERKSKDVIATLIGRGILATINQPLEPKVAIDVAKGFGSTATILTYEEEALQEAYAGRRKDDPSAELGESESVEAPEDRIPRPPVVTVMGHVDHGKTSLLDAYRTATVADGEAGGITQHIGAYQVDVDGRKITFLDTPGHEAFTMMRARGAGVTDIVVLVVAADDGVKPQTLEAIDHAKAAGVPIVIAINKVDKPNAQIDRVKQQLADRDLLVESFGGKTVSVEVSAKQKTGLDDLLELIVLEAELQELRANPKLPASGIVLEARRDRARGVIATVLVQEGTLKVGDAFIAGSIWGKVRAMTDEHGNRIKSAGPSMPVEVMGSTDMPMAGDSFLSVATEAKARRIASHRLEIARAEDIKRKSARRTLEGLGRDLDSVGIKDLAIVLRADVQGSLEAVKKMLGELPDDKVRVQIVRSSIGGITQADVLLAAAANAIVVGFNVRPEKTATILASEESVELRMYTVIYQLVDEIRQAMVGLLDPTFKEIVLGQAEVRQTFKVPKIGLIAGCLVTDGKITRKAELRLLRDNVIIHTGKVSSLRRFKDDASEVKNGTECGIGIAGYNDLKEGDVIEAFMMEKIIAESL